MIINTILGIAVVYLIIRDYQTRKILAHEFFVELAKGNKRYFRGWWKVNPNDYEKIALDKRTHEEIAKDFNVSRSRIGTIKRDYYKQREEEGKKIVTEYFNKK